MELVEKKDFDAPNEIDLSSPVSNISATHALVTNVEFSSGKKSSIVTLFNNSAFSFEEINIGINTSLYRQPWLGIVKRKSILYMFVKGKLKKALEFMN